MLRKTITIAVALIILLVASFAIAAPIRLANDAKVMTVYKGRNCPYTVSLYRENKQLTATEISAITRYVVIYDETYYIDSTTCSDCFTASGANVIVDLGTVNFAVGTDTASEFIIFDPAHPEGQVIGTIKVTIVDDAIAGGALVDPLTSALADLGDVTITNPTNGQGLIYNNGVWANQTPAGGGDMLVSEYNTAGTAGVVDEAATITNQGDLATMDAPPADDGIFYGMLNRVWTQIASTVDWTQPNQGTIDPTNYVDNDTTLSDEQVQDKVGAMTTGNTETGISVTYQDDDGTLDFAISESDPTALKAADIGTTVQAYSANMDTDSTDDFTWDYDFGDLQNVPAYLLAETDPGFNAWLIATPPIYSEVDPSVGTHESSYDHTLIGTALQSETDPLSLKPADIGVTVQAYGDYATNTTVNGKKPYHGVQAIGTLSFDASGHVLTVPSITYWYSGTQYTSAVSRTCDIDSFETLSNNTLYYFYFDDATGTVKCADTFWDLHTKVPVAVVFWNGSAGAIQMENHSHTRNVDWHINAHLTIGARYYNNGGLALTSPTTSLDGVLEISPGTIYDEDLAATTAAASTTCRVLYQVSSGVYTWVNSALPYAGGSADPQYLDTDTYTLTSADDNKYINMWVYFTPDTERNVYIIPSQIATEYTTLALARAENPPALAGLNINSEMKLIHKFIYKGDGQFQESVDYRTASALPSGGTTSIVEVDPTVNTSAEIQAIIGSGVYAPASHGDAAHSETYLKTEVDGSTTNEIEVQDEVFNGTNFNGATASGVSQDDFYDLWHGIDTDDDGDIDQIDSTVWATKAATSHAHTGADLSSIDISDDTNLAGTTNEITLTGDTLSIHSAIARDSELHADESTATTSVAGIVELADDTEAAAGAATDKVMTPAGVAIYVANNAPAQAPPVGYYVATTGNDSAAGDYDHPWLTIQHAVDTAVAGDTINVMPGTYTEQVVFATSGTSVSPITLQSYGGTAIITGNSLNITSYEGLVDAVGTSASATIHDINIKGFTITVSDEYLVRVKYASNVNLINCIVTGNDTPVDTSKSGILYKYCNDCTIETCDISVTEHNAINCESSNRMTVKNNTIHNNPEHNGVNMFPVTTEDPQPLYVGSKIINNVIDGCTNGIYVRYQKDLLIDGNTITNTGAGNDGINIALAGIASDYAYSSNMVISNNAIKNTGNKGINNYNAYAVTVLSNIFQDTGSNAQYWASGTSSGNHIDNNIYLDATESWVWNGGSVLNTLAAWQAATSQDANAATDIGTDDIGTDDQTAAEVPVTTTAFGGIFANTTSYDTLQEIADATDDHNHSGVYEPADTDLTDLADGELTASKVGGVKDADYGDVTVSSGAWAVEDDSHSHTFKAVANTDAASAANVGTIRYRTSGNNSYLDVSMQTGADTYAWVNIVEYNW